MVLSDLMRATKKFSKENIIGKGRTGTVYKEMLSEGCSLMVNRLQHSMLGERICIRDKYTWEHKTWQYGSPVGFCTADKDRLLVYKYVENGMLHDKLHPVEPEVLNIRLALKAQSCYWSS